MFTGLVAAKGTVTSLERDGDGARLEVAVAELIGELSQGDSVAVNGVCLTATRVADESFAADVTAETLRRSALGAAGAGQEVNLELPLRAGDRLGGHVVQGHVDEVGEVELVERQGLARAVRVRASTELLRYVVEKGSIAVDGVSLTVAGVNAEGFAVSLVPETLERTTLAGLAAGQWVNLEVDIFAKYVEKLALRAGRT